MKAKIDEESPWCMIVRPREKHPAVKAVRMVGNSRNPGGGATAYLHIEGLEPGKLLHISGKRNLLAIADMIYEAFK